MRAASLPLLRHVAAPFTLSYLPPRPPPAPPHPDHSDSRIVSGGGLNAVPTIEPTAELTSNRTLCLHTLRRLFTTANSSTTVPYG
jgi:hypothetical protein